MKCKEKSVNSVGEGLQMIIESLSSSHPTFQMLDRQIQNGLEVIKEQGVRNIQVSVT